MAQEQLGNLGFSSLSATISAAATTLTVQSAASFLTVPNFRLNVEGELMLVTGVAGAAFTVTRGVEGTAAVAHNAGVRVAQVVTAQSLLLTPALVNVVTAYGVDNTGGVDAGVLINTAVAALVGSGQRAWLPKGTYLLTTAVTESPGMMLDVAPGTTFTGANAASLSAQASPNTIQQLGTVAAPADTRIWAVQPRDPNKAPFSAYLHDQLFVSTHDSVFFWGYNADNATNTEPVCRWAIEQDYNDGSGDDKCEIYVETYIAGQAHQNRPWFTSLDRIKATSYSLIQWQNATDASAAGFVQFQNITGAQVLKLTDAAIWMQQPIYGTGLSSPVLIGAGLAGNAALNQPFVWSSNGQQPNLTGGPGTLVLTAAQYAAPFVQCMGTMAGNIVLQFPNSPGAFWMVDLTSVVFAGHTVTLQIGANNSAVVPAAPGVWLVTCGADGKPRATAMT